MAAGAFMELSHPDVWGELTDEQALDRKLGAFEIASFSLSANPRNDPRTVDPAFRPRTTAPHPTPAATTAAATGAQSTDPVVSDFTIRKALDKSSPELFTACCKKTPMNWAIITMREQGDDQPYLVIEFQKVMIESFGWELPPGEGEASLSAETINFSFETIYIKYAAQMPSGGHEVPITANFNSNKPGQGVAPLSQ
jgi:type VI secretion system secreted protein Hcp